MTRRVVVDASPRTTTVTALCHECGKDNWDMPEAWTTYDGRALKGKARRHAAKTGHIVSVHTETVRSIRMIPE